ncbi:MAG: hypothetical protein SV253_09515 [Halobacteria archaeon]|nr:hypothetical protein [Halobacteria archaeon]
MNPRDGLSITRRQAVRATGLAALTSLTGCLSGLHSQSESETTEYSFDVESISTSPVEHSLYQPEDGNLFGDPAREALGNILPEGRHTTYGYTPLPDDAYVETEEGYYQVKNTITGRRKTERTVVEAVRVSEENIPRDAVELDDLERPVARVLKILHTNHVTNGEGGASDLLHGDVYVLRRPAETDSRLGTRELDGEVVRMEETGPWAYRIDVTDENITETEYSTLTVKVADSRDEFRDVVFESRVDAEIYPGDLQDEESDLLEKAITDGTYTEETPLTEAFESLLDRLGLDDTSENGHLWYDTEYYSYTLYVDEA